MKVIEIFDSIDGEGIRTGQCATFIRLAGCNLRCSYCDTVYSLFGEETPCEYTEMTVDEIISKVNMTYKRVTLTGGEPLVHTDSAELVSKLTEIGCDVNIETNGAVDIVDFLGKVPKSDNLFFTIDAVSLVGCLMLGNLMKESGVVERLTKMAQNELMNIITLFLGVTVGATATASSFLSAQTIGIIVLGLIAFCFSTAGGLFLGDIMCWVTKGKVNPLIGSAGVSAVPMAARVSQTVGQKENPSNFLLMHAMGPNVAGVIGSAVAAGVFLAMFGNL